MASILRLAGIKNSRHIRSHFKGIPLYTREIFYFTESRHMNSLKIAICRTKCGPPILCGVRTVLLCLFLGVTMGIAFGDTAFDAVQVLKQEKGPGITQAICEIRGERGGPDPDNWMILLNDPSSRSGIREMIVSQKKIISDRTPMAEYGGVGTMPVLNTDNLKLNSDDAFRIANSQAVEAKVGFHWLDYKLTRGDRGALWQIRLSDYTGAPVGNILVSADTGRIVQPLKLDPDARSSSSQKKSEWVQQGGLMGHADQTATHIVNSTKKSVEKTTKITEDIATKTKKKVLHISGNVQEWLTGQRTIDSEER